MWEWCKAFVYNFNLTPFYAILNTRLLLQLILVSTIYIHIRWLTYRENTDKIEIQLYSEVFWVPQMNNVHICIRFYKMGMCVWIECTMTCSWYTLKILILNTLENVPMAMICAFFIHTFSIWSVNSLLFVVRST